MNYLGMLTDLTDPTTDDKILDGFSTEFSMDPGDQEKMRGQRGRLRALAGICHVHESYF